MFYDRDDDSGFRFLFLAIPIVLGIAFIVWPKPDPLPSLANSSAFGCYVTSRAPEILLDAKGMHVMQEKYPVVPFHLERLKTGIAISADQPIQVTMEGGSYRYSFYKPGVGWYLDFYRDANGQRYGVTDDSLLSSFSMLSRRDGHALDYTRAPPNACLALK